MKKALLAAKLALSSNWNVPLRAIALRGFLLAFLVNLPTIYGFIVHDGIVLDVSTDGSTYLSIARNVGQGKSMNFAYLEHQRAVSAWDAITEQPNNIVNYLVGGLAHALNWSPFQLMIFLGLVCFSLAYINFALLFNSFLKDSLLAEMVSALCLLNPLGVISHLTSDGYRNIVALVHLPALRPVYTEISYVLLPLILWVGIRSVLLNPPTRLRSLVAGGCAALLFYIYLFAYLSVVSICSCMYCFKLLFSCNRTERIATIWGLLCYCCASVLLILPGLALIGDTTNTLNEEIRTLLRHTLPSISLAKCGIMAIFAALYLLTRKIPKTASLALVLLSIQAAAIMLPFTQPLAKYFLQTYKFNLLYLEQLQLSFLCAYIFSLLPKLEYRKCTRILGLALAAFLAICLTHDQRILARPDAFRVEQHQFLSAARQQIPKGAVLAVMDYGQPFQPFSPTTFNFRYEAELFSSNIDSYLLHDRWHLKLVSQEEELRRELFLSWLYTGEVKFTWPCQDIKTPSPENSDSSFNHIITWEHIHRRYMLRELCPVVLTQFSLCQAYRDFAVDFLVVEKYVWEAPLSHLSQFATEEWRSPDSNFVLFKINKDALSRIACSANQSN